MQTASIASLLVGIGIGFAPMYIWMQKRAPEILNAMPSASFAQQLQEVVKKDPKNFEALVRLGDVEWKGQQPVEAASWYVKALDVRDDADVRWRLGVAYYVQGRNDEAMTQFEKVLETKPSDPDALYYVGVVLLEGRNDPAGAIAVWEKLIRLNPEYPQIERVRRDMESAKAGRP
jgi:cytochrome c-type biogenesis protein CcmH/NrfG